MLILALISRFSTEQLPTPLTARRRGPPVHGGVRVRAAKRSRIKKGEKRDIHTVFLTNERCPIFTRGLDPGQRLTISNGNTDAGYGGGGIRPPILARKADRNSRKANGHRLNPTMGEGVVSGRHFVQRRKKIRAPGGT